MNYNRHINPLRIHNEEKIKQLRKADVNVDQVLTLAEIATGYLRNDRVRVEATRCLSSQGFTIHEEIGYKTLEKKLSSNQLLSLKIPKAKPSEYYAPLVEKLESWGDKYIWGNRL